MVRCMALSLTSACRVLAPGARLKNEHMSTSSLTCGSPTGSLAGAAKYPEVGPSRWYGICEQQHLTDCAQSHNKQQKEKKCEGDGRRGKNAGIGPAELKRP